MGHGVIRGYIGHTHDYVGRCRVVCYGKRAARHRWLWYAHGAIPVGQTHIGAGRDWSFSMCGASAVHAVRAHCRAPRRRSALGVLCGNAALRHAVVRGACRGSACVARCACYAARSSDSPCCTLASREGGESRFALLGSCARLVCSVGALAEGVIRSALAADVLEFAARAPRATGR